MNAKFRILILIVLTLFTVNAFSQTQYPVGLPNVNSPKNWVIYGYNQDSAYIFVERDTNFLARYPTLIKGIDHNFYYSNGNGSKWNSFSDTAGIHALLATKLNITDTTGKWLSVGSLVNLVKYSDSVSKYVTPKNLKDTSTALRILIAGKQPIGNYQPLGNYLQVANNLLDVANVAAARSNLGLNNGALWDTTNLNQFVPYHGATGNVDITPYNLRSRTIVVSPQNDGDAYNIQMLNYAGTQTIGGLSQSATDFGQLQLRDALGANNILLQGGGWSEISTGYGFGIDYPTYINDGYRFKVKGKVLTDSIDNYLTNMGSLYTVRTKVDKGYTDSSIAPAFVLEAFDTTSRSLTMTRVNGTTQSVIIPRGGSGGGGGGIVSLSNSKTGNVVTIMGDNGSNTSFSINSTDSTTRVHKSDSTVVFVTPTQGNALYQPVGSYLHPTDTTLLSNRITQNTTVIGINQSAITALNNDTATIQPRLDNVLAVANTKLNISDTSYLSNQLIQLRAGKQDAGDFATNTNLNLKVNIADTASMLLPYAKSTAIPNVSGKVNYSDTSAMLSNYHTAIVTNTASIATNTTNISTVSAVANAKMDSVRTNSLIAAIPNYWTRSGTTLTTATANDSLNITRDISIHGMTVGLGSANISTNTANGYQALRLNTTGANNTANGYSALRSNTTGGGNTALGLNSLLSNTIGNSNTALGLSALQSNTTGGGNTALGLSALQSNTTGNNNTANGYQALQSNTTGGGNTALGLQAGYNGSTSLLSMSNSTFLGYGTNSSVDAITNSTALGNGAQVTASNQMVFGNSSVTANLLHGTTTTTNLTATALNVAGIVTNTSAGVLGTVTAIGIPSVAGLQTRITTDSTNIVANTTAIASKQAQLNGTGFVQQSGTTTSYVTSIPDANIASSVNWNGKVDSTKVLMGYVSINSKTTGSVSTYRPSVNTDAARGVALQNAFIAAQIGDAISIGAGDYFITTNLALKDSQTVTLNSSTISHIDTTIDIFYINNVSNISIKGNGTLKGSGFLNGSANSETGIRVIGTCDYPLVDGLTITGFKGAGIYNGTTWSDTTHVFSGGRVSNCNIIRNNVGLNMAGQFWRCNANFIKFNNIGVNVLASNVTVDHNVISYNLKGLIVDGIGGSHDIVDHNEIVHNNNCGIYINNVTIGATFTGNIIAGNYPGTFVDTTIYINSSRGVIFNGGEILAPTQIMLNGTFTGYNYIKNMYIYNDAPIPYPFVYTGTFLQKSHLKFDQCPFMDSVSSYLNNDIIVSGLTIGRGNYDSTLSNPSASTAIGYQALQNNTSGYANTAIGAVAISSNTTGGLNTATGAQALPDNTIGSYNTANGNGAGYNTSKPLRNMNYSTFIGAGATSTKDTIVNSTALGYGATVTGDNQMIYGNTNVTSNLFHGSIIKSGGTSSQFLKADGSIDNSTYLTSAGSYLPLTAGLASPLTGVLYINHPSTSSINTVAYQTGGANKWFLGTSISAASDNFEVYNATTGVTSIKVNSATDAVSIGTTTGIATLTAGAVGSIPTGTNGQVLTVVSGSPAWSSASTTASGTYTPTVTNNTGTSALTGYTSQWSQVGSIVTVSGSASCTNTATTSCSIFISLPVASPSLGPTDCNGTSSVLYGGLGYQGVTGAIFGNATPHSASINYYSGASTNALIYFTFQYKVY